MNRRRDTVEHVVIPFSDADPAVSRKRTPPLPHSERGRAGRRSKSGATAPDDQRQRHLADMLQPFIGATWSSVSTMALPLLMAITIPPLRSRVERSDRPSADAPPAA